MDPDVENSIGSKSGDNSYQKYPSMVPALTSSELAILSRPSSPVPPKIRPKVKERPTLFCFDRNDFEEMRPQTARSSKNPVVNKPQRTSRPRNRISVTKSRNNPTSPNAAPTAANIFKRRSRSLQSPSVSTEKLYASFDNPECEVFEGQAVFRSKHSLKTKPEPSLDSQVENRTENGETDDFCRMEELVNYLTLDQEKILKELSHGIDVSTEFDPIYMAHASVQTVTKTADNCPEKNPEATLQRIQHLEEANRFCTTEIQTLRDELSQARRIIAEKSRKIEKLHPNEGPPWVVPSEENAFRPPVDYFSFRTIDEPTCVAKVRLYQPGMSIKRSLSPSKQKNQISPRGKSAPADKSYLGLHHQRLRYESCTDAKRVISKPPISPASRTRSLPGKADTSSNVCSNGHSNFMKPHSNGQGSGGSKSNIEYLAIALASREGLLREIAYSIKKAKKILHFRFNMLLASEFSMEDLHFLLTSHRRFLRWLNNYVHYSMSLVERFDSKYVKTHSFYVPAILDGDRGDVHKGIFIPVPGKDMPNKKPVKTLKRSSVETQTDRPCFVCSYAQCQPGARKDFSHQADTTVSEPQVDACVQTYIPLKGEKSTMAFRSANVIPMPSVSKVTSCRNVALEQLLKNLMESQEIVESQSTIVRPELQLQDFQTETRACATRSGNKICAANFGASDSRLTVHHKESEASDNANSSETPSSEPFVDCSSKESEYSVLTQESSASIHPTESYRRSNCKGDYYDPLPSGTDLLTREGLHPISNAVPTEVLQSSSFEIFSPLDLIMDSHMEEAEQFYNHKGNADFRAVDLSEFVFLHDDCHIENQTDPNCGRPCLPARKLETVEDYAEFFDETLANFKRKQADCHDLPKFKSAAQVVLDILHDRHESMLFKQKSGSNSSKTPSISDTDMHGLTEIELATAQRGRASESTRIYCPVDSELDEPLPKITASVNHECKEAADSCNECLPSAEKAAIKTPEVPLSSPRSRLPVPVSSAKRSPKPEYQKPGLGHGSNDSTSGNLTQESHCLTPKSSMTSRVIKVRDKVKKSFIPVKKQTTTVNASKKFEGEITRTVHQVAVPRVLKGRDTCLQGNSRSRRPFEDSAVVKTNLKVFPSARKTAETISKRKSLSKMLNFTGRKSNQSKANSNL